MQPNVNHSCLLWGFVLTSLWAFGCADDSTCDPGQELDNGLCRAVPEDRGAGGEGGIGGSAAAGAPGDAGSAGQASCEVQFGDACSDDGDCGCDAPLCATLPGNFMCTNTCDDDPDVCPEGFVCEDLSRFGDFPATCFPEGALSF